MYKETPTKCPQAELTYQEINALWYSQCINFHGNAWLSRAMQISADVADRNREALLCLLHFTVNARSRHVCPGWPCVLLRGTRSTWLFSQLVEESHIVHTQLDGPYPRDGKPCQPSQTLHPDTAQGVSVQVPTCLVFSIRRACLSWLNRMQQTRHICMCGRILVCKLGVFISYTQRWIQSRGYHARTRIQANRVSASCIIKATVAQHRPHASIRNPSKTWSCPTAIYLDICSAVSRLWCSRACASMNAHRQISF